MSSSTDKFKKHHTDALRRKVIVGSVGGVVVMAYVLHRKRMTALASAWQVVRDESVWASFDSGVQYGIGLAQKMAAGEVVSTDDVKEAAKKAGYAFSAFDKPSA